MLSRFELRTVIIFGAGSVSKVGEEAATLGRKALIVTYPDIRRVGLLDRILSNVKEKGIDAVIFEKVECNPRSTTVDEGAEVARKEKPDFLIGLGGGSVMDTTKGIALGSSGESGESRGTNSTDHPGTDYRRHWFRAEWKRSFDPLGITY